MPRRDDEAFKLECLARHVARLPTQAARAVWLNEYRQIHGDAAANSLGDAARVAYGKLKKSGTANTR